MTRRWRLALAGASWLFAGCVLAQVTLAGLGVFRGPGWWPRHASFVHAFEWLTLVILGLTFPAKAPRGTKWLAGGIVGVLFLQYVTAGFRATPARTGWASLHATGALVLFWLATEVARRAGALAREGDRPNL